MAADYLTCPMCGFEFAKGDTLCAHGCPLGNLCRLVQCPNCEYEFPETPPAVTWFKRVFRRRLPVSAALPEGVRTAVDLNPGEQAEVVCLGRSAGTRSDTLTVFGLVPGSIIELIQRQPACVIRIDQTELALDPEIARDILVRAPA
jgi:Fe2+ transport system protein FeoA